MGMYQRVELMQVNGLLDIPFTQEIIYVYKITCKHTGHFYIGQTNSIKDRIYMHLRSMMSLFEGQQCTCQHFHRIIVNEMMPLYLKRKKGISSERFSRESLDVFIIAIVTDNQAANIVEQFYIGKNSKQKLCLNQKSK